MDSSARWVSREAQRIIDRFRQRKDKKMTDAPRFRFMWQRIEAMSVLTMPREDWNAAVGTLGSAVVLDVRSTPVSAVTLASSIVASVAHQFGPSTARVSIYRYDEADAPTPINIDEYEVWTDLGAHPRLPEMLTAASTSDNENFRTFCGEHVFFVKRRPGPDHWLPTLPSSVAVLMKSTG